MITQTAQDPAPAEVATADTMAARRVLLHVVAFMELLTADIKALMTALDKGPGEASALAAKLLDDPEDLWRYNPDSPPDRSGLVSWRADAERPPDPAIARLTACDREIGR